MGDDASLLFQALSRTGRTLAVAESFTGGRILDALTDVAGASRVLQGGIVAYRDDVKTDVLAVPVGLIRTHGAVSQPVAEAMAQGARSRFGADYAVAATGIAGPTGAAPGKPVGLSYCAAAGTRHVATTRRVHAGSRREVKEGALRQALDVLGQVLRLEGTL